MRVVALVALLAVLACIEAAPVVSPAAPAASVVPVGGSTLSPKAPPSPKKMSKKKKETPGAATLRAAAKAAAAPKASKDELKKWVRENSPELTPGQLDLVDIYFDRVRLIHTIDEMLALGPEGIDELLVPDTVRDRFKDLLVKRIGRQGFDDGMMVTVPKYVPPKDKDGCPRFLAVNNAAPSPVGDWLRRSFSDVKPVVMSRAILALQRQTIRTFDDLIRVAGDTPAYGGIDTLVNVPTGLREALREALIYHVGTQGHDDGKPVYVAGHTPPWEPVPPSKPKPDCSNIH